MPRTASHNAAQQSNYKSGITASPDRIGDRPSPTRKHGQW